VAKGTPWEVVRRSGATRSRSANKHVIGVATTRRVLGYGSPAPPNTHGGSGSAQAPEAFDFRAPSTPATYTRAVPAEDAVGNALEGALPNDEMEQGKTAAA